MLTESKLKVNLKIKSFKLVYKVCLLYLKRIKTFRSKTIEIKAY